MMKTKKEDIAGKARYEGNGLLKYLFRGIEEFAPWVNKIYFVTYGHLPSFLNLNAEKLVVVNHKGFFQKNIGQRFLMFRLTFRLFKVYV